MKTTKTTELVWALLYPTPGIVEAVERVEARDTELRVAARREPLEVLRRMVEMAEERPSHPHPKLMSDAKALLSGEPTSPHTPDSEPLRVLCQFFDLDWRSLINAQASACGGYQCAAQIRLIERALQTADVLLAGEPESTEPTATIPDEFVNWAGDTNPHLSRDTLVLRISKLVEWITEHGRNPQPTAEAVAEAVREACAAEFDGASPSWASGILRAVPLAPIIAKLRAGSTGD